MYRAFALGGVLLLGSILWAAADDLGREWKPIQAEYAALVEGAPVPIELRQHFLPELGAVDRCVSCHLGVDNPDMAGRPPPHGLHPGTHLATHPPERFGCTSCHGGDGRGTTYATASHVPSERTVLPMASTAGIEARCGLCHQGPDVPGAPHLSAGRKRLESAGCAACHQIPGIALPRPMGPPLAGVGHKLARSWIVSRLKDPAEREPAARMPRFRLDEEQRELLADFITSLPGPRLEDADPLNEGDPEAGRSLFGQSRCTTCHSLKGKGGTLAPPLDRIGEKVEARWLVAWLMDPQRLFPQTLMARFRFTRQQALDLAEFLLEEMVADDAPEKKPEPPRPPPPPERLEAGRRLADTLGCAACHEVPGLDRTRQFAPSLRDIGARSVHRLTFAGMPDGTHRTLSDWLYRKTEAPELGFPDSRMPTSRLTPVELADLTLAMLSLQEVRWPATVIRPWEPPAAWQPQGEIGALVRRYRCMSCHALHGFGGDVANVTLDREGSKVRPAWLVDFLVLPDTIRVGQEARMPIFRMTREEASMLATFIDQGFRDDRIPLDAPGPGDVEQGRGLFESLGCRACHIQGKKGGYVGPDLIRTGVRLRSGWVYTLMKSPGVLQPDIVHPDYVLTGVQALALTAFLMTLRPAEVAP